MLNDLPTQQEIAGMMLRITTTFPKFDRIYIEISTVSAKTPFDDDSSKEALNACKVFPVIIEKNWI